MEQKNKYIQIPSHKNIFYVIVQTKNPNIIKGTTVLKKFWIFVQHSSHDFLYNLQGALAYRSRVTATLNKKAKITLFFTHI